MQISSIIPPHDGWLAGLGYSTLFFCWAGQALASFPGAEEGPEKERLVHTVRLARAHNYSKDSMAGVGACTNMMINASREWHKLSKIISAFVLRTL